MFLTSAHFSKLLQGALGLMCFLFISSCGDTKPKTKKPVNPKDTLIDLEKNSAVDKEQDKDKIIEEEEEVCVFPKDLSSSITSIDDVVSFVNALPLPVSLVCFLEALPRPLSLNATTSKLSVQPADGPENPRIFIILDPLIFSLTTVGNNHDSKTLEISWLTSLTTSVKAEILFPVTKRLSREDPFKAILRKDGVVGTRCGGCHANEAPAEGLLPAEAFVSKAFRPFSSSDVSITSLQNERILCQTDRNERCRRLRALFDHGEVEAVSFPQFMPTMFSN